MLIDPTDLVGTTVRDPLLANRLRSWVSGWVRKCSTSCEATGSREGAAWGIGVGRRLIAWRAANTRPSLARLVAIDGPKLAEQPWAKANVPVGLTRGPEICWIAAAHDPKPT